MLKYLPFILCFVNNTIMGKKSLSIFSAILLIIVIILAISYTIKQFDTVEHRLKDTTETVFYKAVDASYDIIDTTVNESLRSYLKGITFSIEQFIELTHNKNLQLNDDNVKKALDILVNQTRIGKSGYIAFISPAGILTSHPYMKDQDVSNLNLIQKQLRSPTTFIEYPWKNPNDTESRLKVAYSKKLPDGSVISASVYKDEMLDLIDKELLKEKLKRYNFGKTGYVYVADSHGKLVLHPTNEGQSIRTLINDNADQFMTQVKQKHFGTFTYTILTQNGKKIKKTVAYKYYPYLDWIIAAGITQKELTQSTDQLFHSLAMALICLLLLIAGLVLGLNSRHKRILLIEKKDYLTGLNNRRTLVEYIQEQKTQSNYSIIIFDIDNFKKINDNFGHSEGDKAIIATANILKKLESKRVIISRHGGEEFVIYLSGINQHKAYILAEIIRYKVSQISNLKTSFTISAGIYESKSGQDDINNAISYADQALYKAKNTGRNQTITYQEE